MHLARIWFSYLSCEFDLSLKNTEASGSPRLCDAAVDDSCKPFHIEEYTLTIPIVIVVVVIVANSSSLCLVHYIACVLFGARVPHPPQEDCMATYQSVN